MKFRRPPSTAIPSQTRHRANRPPRARRLDKALRAGGSALLAVSAVVLLYLAYQFWWTDVQANGDQYAARQQLEQQWTAPRPTAPAKLAPGQRFALLRVPKLDLTVAIAQGTDKQQVLDHGLVGHDPNSAMPADPAGNVVLAGHRNTHGEPFRHLPRLVPGDAVTIETATATYAYTVRGTIPQTSPDNTAVLRAIPAGSPFTRPGRYLTLLTCTPDFTSWYRFVAFAQLTAIQPKPAAQPQPSATASQHGASRPASSRPSIRWTHGQRPAQGMPTQPGRPRGPEGRPPA